jgi:hypothetical protein
MDVGLLECVAGLNLLLLGWLHMRQNSQEKRLENKVDKEDFVEVKADIKEILRGLIDVKVENARWQGLVEKVVNSKLEKS